MFSSTMLTSSHMSPKLPDNAWQLKSSTFRVILRLISPICFTVLTMCISMLGSNFRTEFSNSRANPYSISAVMKTLCMHVSDSSICWGVILGSNVFNGTFSFRLSSNFICCWSLGMRVYCRFRMASLNFFCKSCKRLLMIVSVYISTRSARKASFGLLQNYRCERRGFLCLLFRSIPSGRQQRGVPVYVFRTWCYFCSSSFFGSR